MNASETARLEGFGAMLDTDGRALQVVSSGEAFTGVINAAPAFDPATELGSDVREKVLLEVIQPGPVLAENDYVTDPETGDKWQVTHRDNNTADFTVQYWMAKVIAGLDA